MPCNIPRNYCRILSILLFLTVLRLSHMLLILTLASKNLSLVTTLMDLTLSLDNPVSIIVKILEHEGEQNI